MKDFLDYACQKYYEGSPILSDEEFDRLAQNIEYVYLGYTSSTNRIPHMYPMYSLQKVYKGESSPFNASQSVVVTPKLDGAAVSLLYVNGDLKLSLTRGDGTKGLDITDKLLELAPSTLPFQGTVQITGEIVAPKSIRNSRNYAAGALNLGNLEEFRSRELKFIAYDIYPPVAPLWSEAMEILRSNGVPTVLCKDWSEYPTDGEVFRLDSYTEFESLGYTSHHPRGAFALKERREGAFTRLLDVVWQVGRSGVVSPVAILEPVDIDGATVSRATLHNMKYIQLLGLEIGCEVEVIRAGEIIPRVVGRRSSN